MDIVVRVGDTGVFVTAALKSGGVAYDLTHCTVSAQLRSVAVQSPLIQIPCLVTDPPTSGVVTFNCAILSIGRYHFEIMVTTQDQLTLTFPSTGVLQLVVIDRV